MSLCCLMLYSAPQLQKFIEKLFCNCSAHTSGGFSKWMLFCSFSLCLVWYNLCSCWDSLIIGARLSFFSSLCMCQLLWLFLLFLIFLFPLLTFSQFLFLIFSLSVPSVKDFKQVLLNKIDTLCLSNFVLLRFSKF